MDDEKKLKLRQFRAHHSRGGPNGSTRNPESVPLFVVSIDEAGYLHAALQVPGDLNFRAVNEEHLIQIRSILSHGRVFVDLLLEKLPAPPPKIIPGKDA